jgi:hypothetical protein
VPVSTLLGTGPFGCAAGIEFSQLVVRDACEAKHAIQVHGGMAFCGELNLCMRSNSLLEPEMPMFLQASTTGFSGEFATAQILLELLSSISTVLDLFGFLFMHHLQCLM